ncbi:MAG: hypothetical protein ACP5XB_29825 [Isosphaeraceae bacterium]
MTLPLQTGVTLLVATALAWQSAEGQGKRAAGPSRPAHADLKVAIWYRRDRPLDTFKYQVYDLRKGEYTAAVEEWLALMQSKYTTYVVAIRDVDLAHEKGETEKLKVGSVVKRDLLAAAAIEGVFLGEPARPVPPRAGLPPRSELPGQAARFHPGSSGPINLNPPRPSFPVPMPYPRPHP